MKTVFISTSVVQILEYQLKLIMKHNIVRGPYRVGTMNKSCTVRVTGRALEPVGQWSPYFVC